MSIPCSARFADRIRAHVDPAYVQPARESGRSELIVRAGDVHSTLGLHNRMPAVCGALRAKELEQVSGVELIEHTGPRYREFLAEWLQQHGIAVDIPMKGVRIGQQRAWLGSHARGGSPGV